MKGKTALLAVTAIALVAGCNRGATNNAAANSSAANTAAPAAPAPAAGGGGAVDQAFLLGHWGRGGDCSETISFNANGTAAFTGEDDALRWTLSGDALTIIENNDPPETGRAARSGDMLVLTSPEGDTMQLSRCPAAGAGRTDRPIGPGGMPPPAPPKQ